MIYKRGSRVVICDKSAIQFGESVHSAHSYEHFLFPLAITSTFGFFATVFLVVVVVFFPPQELPPVASRPSCQRLRLELLRDCPLSRFAFDWAERGNAMATSS